MSNPDSGAPGAPPPQKTPAPLEMASVLFMDIVSYSLEPMERQSSLLADLSHIVRETSEFQRAQQCNQIISLPTGDGMALVFFDTPLLPVECALQVARSLRNYPDLKLRMGVHTGPVYRINDINANMNVAGGGINMAQRVMDAGDAGHLIVSSAVAEVLRHLSGWPQYLKDLGEHAVKHGVKMHLYAICTDDVANHEVPQKLKKAAAPAPQPSAAAAPPAPVAQASPARGLYMAVGSIVTILVLAFALTKGPSLFDSGRAASLPPTQREKPVTFEKEPETGSKTQAAGEARRELKGTTPVPSARQLQAEQERTAVAPPRTTRPEPQATAQMSPAVVVPAPVPQVTQAAPQTPQIDPAKEQELRNASELLMNLRTRASATEASLASMKQQQASMGMNLRGDVVSAEQRMQYYLVDAQNMLRAGDAEKAKTSLKNAERALETVEKFLGR